EGRNLEPEVVRTFADGRDFTGQQAVDLGLVDRLGTEEDARRWAAELAGLDPDKAKTFTIEAPKSWLSRLRSDSKAQSRLQFLLSEQALSWLEFEVSTSGLPLWLYRP
ncbi:MAG: S49 family peptidase, partial [Thermosynechococcaceae cyanobacterium]